MNSEKIVNDAINRSLELLNENSIFEAELVLEQVLKVNPKELNAKQLLALTKYKKGDSVVALNLFKEVIEEEPNNHQAHNNLSLCFSYENNMEMALFHIRKAIKICPTEYAYHNNLAMRLSQSGNRLEAIKSFKKAAKLGKKDANVLTNLGNTYGIKDVDKAIKSFKSALEINPEHADAHVNLAYAYFFKGQLNKAWPHYEYRLESFPQAEYFKKIYPNKRLRRWDDIQGKTIVVYCEQGAGDFIQFSRYLPVLIKLGVNVLLHTPPELISLFKNNFPCEIAEDFRDREYDYVCSVLSLPYLLNTKISGKPYLKIDKKIDLPKDKFKIGIVWAGSPLHPNDMDRSCKAEFFNVLNDIENVKIYSLQKDLRKRAYLTHPEPIDLAEGIGKDWIDMSEVMNDYNDTAVIISSLDLVICVDTSVLHLAGALGKPCWGLITENPDWRWGLTKNVTKWYNSVRLFRKNGSWEELFQRIRHEKD